MPNLSDIARALGATLPENAIDRPIRRVSSLDEAGPDDLSYVTSDRYYDRLMKSKAGAILAPTKLTNLPETAATVIRVGDAELAMGKVLMLMAPPVCRPAVGVHPSAVVAADVTLGEGVAIGPNVSIAAGATVGKNTVLHAGVVVGELVQIGDDCELYPNVVLRERVVLGSRVILHANATIGTDGFGYRWDGKQQMKIPQIGIVVIEDDVEVGSNSCIDRAKFGETRIGRGTKIDNLVQIGHNVRIGQHCVICGQVGIAGSTTIGNFVVMGGNSAAADHANIADGVMIAARGAVMGQTEPKQVLAGAPAVPHREWLKQQAIFGKLPELVKELRRLSAEVEALKAKS
jgi:UDP-3-O-[3-hydroxymyristoyl] glucosamine N-acyltransferase